jgi:DNA-binding IclR family transcriptional regulator
MKTPSVPALERGLRILELISSSKTGLTFSQIAKMLTMPKSSIHSLLLTFERTGYLSRSEASGKYICGMKLIHLARSAPGGVVLVEQAAGLLRRLADSIGFTVHMGIWEGCSGTLIAKVEPYSESRLATWVGKRIDFHCTSIGKCLVAQLDEAEVEQLVKRYGLLRHNENTIATLPRLKQELAKVRSAGYAIDDEEEELGVRCLGVPVFAPDGSVTSAISISGSAPRIDNQSCKALSMKLKATAQLLTERLVDAQGSEPKRLLV